MTGAAEWGALLQACTAVFTWMIRVADAEGTRAHDAYHRFLRAGAWSLTALWRTLAGLIVARLPPNGPLVLDLDDTLFHKTGRKTAGAGFFRDPVRSTARTVVYARGLNLVVPRPRPRTSPAAAPDGNGSA